MAEMSEARMSETFEQWIEALEVDVIQGSFGYEPGEFAVYPEHWKPAFDAGHSPAEAFQRALDAYGEARAEREREKQENWARIQEADRLAIERYRAAHPQS